MWIATDQCGDKWLFKDKPTREGRAWASQGEAYSLNGFFKDLVPSFVEQQQWKDAPIQVKFEIKKK